MPTAAVVLAASLARTLILGRLITHDAVAYYAIDAGTSLLVYAGAAILISALRNAHCALGEHPEKLEQQAAAAEQRLRLEWSIRRAVVSDVNAIIELMVFGAESGDLSKQLLTQSRQQALRASYAASIPDLCFDEPASSKSLLGQG